MKVTMHYGAGNNLTREFTPGDTIATAQAIATTALGLPESAEATVHGAPQCTGCALVDGMVIVFADKPDPKGR